MNTKDADACMIAFRVKMEQFMRGEWTLDKPTSPGVYPVCGRGFPPGHSTVVVYRNAATDEMCCTTPWGGWWWSEAFPELPPPPDFSVRTQ